RDADQPQDRLLQEAQDPRPPRPLPPGPRLRRRQPDRRPRGRMSDPPRSAAREPPARRPATPPPVELAPTPTIAVSDDDVSSPRGDHGRSGRSPRHDGGAPPVAEPRAGVTRQRHPRAPGPAKQA